MSNKSLHIVAFDIPFPPDYGGTIDVYHKAKALAELGVKIKMHCFEYGRERSEKLAEFCDEVKYYKRDVSIKKQFSFRPFIATSRNNEELKRALLEDDDPILLEGIHCAAILEDKRFSKRKIMLRAHNVEHRYYWKLFAGEKRLGHKFYNLIESLKLKWYEPVLKKADHILSVSEAEHNYHLKKFGKSDFIIPFHAFDEVSVKSGTGDYMIYHGNLSVPENYRAVSFLLDAFEGAEDLQLIIAGKKGPDFLRKRIAGMNNVQLKEDVSSDELQQLIADAHIQLMYTHQATGLKLKLINSIFRGRFILANDLMLTGTGAEDICTIANTAETFVTEARKLMQSEFTQDHLQKRQKLIQGRFSNNHNATLLLNCI